MNRICSKCGISKSIDDFHKDKKGRNGRSSRCKECAKRHVKLWARKKFHERYEEATQKRQKSAELLAQGMKQCSKCSEVKPTSEYFSDPRKKDGLYAKCKTCHIEITRDWDARNPQKKAEIARASKERNRETINELKRERWKNDKEHREKELAISRSWKKSNADRVQKYRKQYGSKPEKKEHRNHLRRERLTTDPAYKLETNLRRRVIKALKGEAKSKRTMELIGCDHAKLIAHIESQFDKEMSWENYGYKGWHLDHIIPCAAFDLTDPEQQKACFHYTNLQPLWGEENLAKGDTLLEKNQLTNRLRIDALKIAHVSAQTLGIEKND